VLALLTGKSGAVVQSGGEVVDYFENSQALCKRRPCFEAEIQYVSLTIHLDCKEIDIRAQQLIVVVVITKSANERRCMCFMSCHDPPPDTSYTDDRRLFDMIMSSIGTEGQSDVGRRARETARLGGRPAL